jgi:hypothetical protein
MLKNLSLLTALGLGSLIAAKPAAAIVIGFGGDAVPLPLGATSVDPITTAPPDLPPPGLATYFFNESQLVTIAPPAIPIFAEVAVANLPPGDTGAIGDDTFADPLGFGTFSSHYLHFDSGAAPPGTVISTGFVTFSAPIAGVIFFSTTLLGSDGLAAPPVVTYTALPTPGMLARGIEEAGIPGADVIFISADRLTLDFSLTNEVLGDFDQIRVITVPFEFEATTGLALLGLYGAWEFSKRKRKASVKLNAA